MNDLEKPKDQLIHELRTLRNRIAELEMKEDEHEKIEKNFKESLAQSQSLIEGVSNFVVYQLAIDKKNPSFLQVVFVSPSVKEILGISEPYKIKNLFEIMNPEDAERVKAANQKAIETKKFNETFRIYHPQKKEWRWVRAISTGMLNETGETEYINGVLFDITEQKNTEEALRESHEKLDLLVKERTEELKNSEERFRMVAEITDDALFEWNLANNKAWRSEAYHKIFGYREIPDRFDWWTKRVHPDDRSRILESVEAVIKEGGKSWSGEYRFQKADGSFAHVFDRCYIVRNEEGNPVRFVGSMMDISERKRLEEQLHQSEWALGLITDNAKDGVWLSDLNFRPIWISPSVSRNRGFTFEELVNMPMDRNLTPDSLRKVQEVIAEKMTPERLADPTAEISTTMELEFFRKDGTTYWSDTITTLIRDQSGTPTGILGVGRDITERKQAEDALRESEFKYRNLFNSINEGMALHEMIYDDQGRAIDYLIIEVNPAYEKQTGLSLETVKNQLAGKIYGSEPPPFLDIYARVAGTGEPVNFESYFPPLKKHFKVSVFSPKKEWFATIFEDITEQKVVMEALTEREIFYQAIFEQAGDGVLILDPKGKIKSVNKKFAEIHGYTVEEILSYGLNKIDIERDTLPPYRTDRILAGQTLNFEVEHYHKDGHTFPLMVTANLISSDHEKFILAIHRDISERKRMEKELRDSEERYRILFERGADGIVILDPETTRPIQFNDQACYQLGYTREEFAKLILADIDIKESTAETRDRIDDVIENRFDDFETLQRTKSGEIRNVHVTAQAFETAKGLVYNCIWRDITDQKRAEAEKKKLE
jgi:PAS domain S-box-containing protein